LEPVAGAKVFEVRKRAFSRRVISRFRQRLPFSCLTAKLISGGPTDHPYRWTQAAV
jgi:hypothetical protein